MHVCGGNLSSQEDPTAEQAYETLGGDLLAGCETRTDWRFVTKEEDRFVNLFGNGSPTRGIAAHLTPMMIKTVVTNGEERVLLQQAALAPLSLKSAPILLASVGGLGCTLEVGGNPRG